MRELRVSSLLNRFTPNVSGCLTCRFEPMQQPEKRKTQRRTVRYPAAIELDDGVTMIQCTLCDASQEGAQLIVGDASKLPDQFTLVLGYDGTARRLCHVVRRAGNQVGVEFKKARQFGFRPLSAASAATKE
jgi:hypothetical protein